MLVVVVVVVVVIVGGTALVLRGTIETVILLAIHRELNASGL